MKSTADPHGPQRFYSLSNRITGVIAVAVCVVVAAFGALGLDDGVALWVVALMVFLAAFSWCALLRQTIELDDEAVTLHNVFDSVRLPLTSVESIATSHVVRVYADGRVFASAALGRSGRSMRKEMRAELRGKAGQSRSSGLFGLNGFSGSVFDANTGGPRSAPSAGGGTPDGGGYEDLVAQAILGRRDRATWDARDCGEFRRTWARPELIVLAVSLVVTVVLFLLR